MLRKEKGVYWNRGVTFRIQHRKGERKVWGGLGNAQTGLISRPLAPRKKNRSRVEKGVMSEFRRTFVESKVDNEDTSRTELLRKKEKTLSVESRGRRQRWDSKLEGLRAVGKKAAPHPHSGQTNRITKSRTSPDAASTLGRGKKIRKLTQARQNCQEPPPINRVMPILKAVPEY